LDNEGSLTVAPAADGPVDETAEDVMSTSAHLAHAIAVGARSQLCPGRAAAAETAGAVLHADHLDLFPAAADRFLEGYVNFAADVGSLLRGASLDGDGAGEEGVEDVAQSRGEVPETVEPAAVIGMPETVVDSPSVGVAEDLIGFDDLLESLRRSFVMVVVGMIPEGQLAEGLPDLLRRGFWGYAQQAVVVLLQRHGGTNSTGGAVISS
jgi:hypothetical protein